MQYKLYIMVMVIIDAAILALSPVLALYVRFEGLIEESYDTMLMLHLPSIVVIQLMVFFAFKLYHRSWRYAGICELFALVAAPIVGMSILFVFALVNDVKMPKSIYIMSIFFNIVMSGAVRLVIRQISNRRPGKQPLAVSKVLIIGVGSIGATIVNEIRYYYRDTKRIIGFIDDDPDNLGKIINGIKVIGNRYDIFKIVSNYGVEELIIAISSSNSILVREIKEMCQNTKCAIKIVPSIHEVIDGMVTIRQLRDINIDDLLRREPVRLDMALMRQYLDKKRILVTGAGGSIGSEFCRQLARMSPGKLILLDKSENDIFEIERELRWNYPHQDIVPIIADVTNRTRINRIFAELRPEIVFHAAAHKHVPLMEAQPVEAVHNNIFGTKIVAEAAVAVGTECFVMTSTDKAINPTSIMGATKRVAEMVICSMNGKGATKFATVRFGNVLGSSGSVVPYFLKQIDQGKDITVTHTDMCRYFMTIPEAAQLVLQAGAMAQGGEVFVLDMGKPVKIVDLACNLIELAGLIPHRDIKIKFTGMRPGEKLFEELLSAEEGSAATKHEKIFMAALKQVDAKKLNRELSILENIDDTNKIIAILSNIVPAYQSSQEKQVLMLKDNMGQIATGIST